MTQRQANREEKDGTKMHVHNKRTENTIDKYTVIKKTKTQKKRF